MQDPEAGSQISELGFDHAYAYEEPDFEMASTIEGLLSSFDEHDKRIAVGFDAQSLEVDAKKTGRQLSERDLPLPPQSAKVITIFGGGLKDLLPGYLIKVATKSKIERINLWSFDIEEIKNLFDYLHKNPPTSFIGIQTIFNFMSPVLYPNERGKKANDRRFYPLDELFNELKEWEKDRFGIPNLKVSFSDYERTGTDITKIVTNRGSLPTFMNLYVTLPQTATKLNQIRGLEVGVLGQKKPAF